MSHESFPASPHPSEALIQPDGSLNEPLFSERFGLGSEELNQIVTFGNYTGTVARMLSDERCPVGGMIQNAYQEGGITGVQQRFKTLGELSPGFAVKISETTIVREQLKKN